MKNEIKPTMNDKISRAVTKYCYVIKHHRVTSISINSKEGNSMSMRDSVLTMYIHLDFADFLFVI